MKPNTLSAYKIKPSHILQLIAVMAFPASLVIFGIDDRWPSSALLDVPSFLIVVAVAIGGAFLLKYGGNQPIAQTLLATGVPMGLIASYIGVVVLVSKIDDGTAYLGYALAVMLITALYGGLVSALGYAINDASSSTMYPIKKRYLVIFSVSVIALILMGIGENGELFFDPIIFSMYLTFILSFLVLGRGKEHFTVVIADAALFASVIIIIFSLIFWFGIDSTADNRGELIRETIVFSSLGVMYGSLIYLLTYIVSLGCVIEQRIDVKKMNWHLTEVNAFLLFLAFAPTSFSNYMEERQASEENAIVIEGLVDRIEELERTQ
ncbi:hypothetical protein N8302_04205 [Gammaproteobacteria bacterium]|nr:hypothetical protein [Gammaproteobacteria bacterium]